MEDLLLGTFSDDILGESFMLANELAFAQEMGAMKDVEHPVEMKREREDAFGYDGQEEGGEKKARKSSGKNRQEKKAMLEGKVAELAGENANLTLESALLEREGQVLREQLHALQAVFSNSRTGTLSKMAVTPILVKPFVPIVVSRGEIA